MRIEYIRIYSEDKEFEIQNKAEGFLELMLDNPDKIHSDKQDSTLKVYLRFHYQPPFSQLYSRDEYNGKDATFFVDDSLSIRLESLQDNIR